MRREERVTVQGPVKEQQPDGMSHRGGAWVQRWVGGWVGPKFQHFGLPGTPSPRGGWGCAGFVKGSEPCWFGCAILHLFGFSFCLNMFKACFPLCAENSVLVFLHRATHSHVFLWNGDQQYPNGVASFLRTTANGGFSIKCLYVTVGGGHRPPPPWVGGWVAEPWPRPKLTPPPPRDL